MIAISELTDDELKRAVRGLRMAGFVSEREFYDQVIAFAHRSVPIVDFTGIVSPVAERFFAAAQERFGDQGACL